MQAMRPYSTYYCVESTYCSNGAPIKEGWQLFEPDARKILTMTISMLRFLIISSLSVLCISAVLNKEVSRIVDASTSVIRVSTSIKAFNVNGEYQLIYPNDVASHLAYLSVTSKGSTLTVNAPVM